MTEPRPTLTIDAAWAVLERHGIARQAWPDLRGVATALLRLEAELDAALNALAELQEPVESDEITEDRGSCVLARWKEQASE